MNVALCGRCGDFLRSRYRHHYTTCGCGALSLDGGMDYQRISWDPDYSGQHYFPTAEQYWGRIHDLSWH